MKWFFLLLTILTSPSQKEISVVEYHNRVKIAHRIYVRQPMPFYIDTTVVGDDTLMHLHPEGYGYERGVYFAKIDGKYRVFYHDLTKSWNGIEAPIHR